MIDGSTRLEVADRAVAMAKPRVKRRRVTIGLLLLGIIASVLGFELILKALPAALRPPQLRTVDTFYSRRAQWQSMITGDPDLGFKLRADVDTRFPFESGAVPIKTVSHGLGSIGFRDIGTQAPYGAIVIGDSFAFCDEVVAEDCWIRRLSDSSGISMATLGVSGYSSLAEARVLKRYGPAFHAPLVVVAIFPNDFADNVNFDAWSREGGDDLRTWLEQKRSPHLASSWFVQHSNVYRLVDAAVNARARSIHRHREDGLNLVLRFDDWWMKIVKGAERHPGWPLMKQALLDMRDSTAAMGARLAVVIFPTKEEAYFDIVRRYVPSLEAADGDRVPRLVNAFLAEQGIFGCDVTGELREQGRRGHQLYYPISGHFNEAGNHLAAAAVERCLAAGGLLRPQSLQVTR